MRASYNRGSGSNRSAQSFSQGKVLPMPLPIHPPLPGLRLLACAALCGISAVATASPAPLTPLGESFPVTEPTIEKQFDAGVARAANGTTLVVWRSFELYDNARLLARRYDANGQPLGQIVRIDPPGSTPYNSVRVAAGANGTFVAVWPGRIVGGERHLYAQRLDTIGTPVGTPVIVEETLGDRVFEPKVAVDGTGGFLVSWEADTPGIVFGRGIYSRRFNAQGVAQSPELLVSDAWPMYQEANSVALSAAGEGVVVWKGGADNNSIVARRLARNGKPRGAAFVIQEFVDQFPMYPGVGMDSRGGFVVAWNDYFASSDAKVVYRVFGADGLARGPQKIATEQTRTDINNHPQVAVDADGDFAITWALQRGALRLFDASGTPRSAEVLLSDVDGSRQFWPNVAMDADGDPVATWVDSFGDPEHYRVLVQRYSGPENVDLEARRVNDVPSIILPGTNFTLDYDVLNRHNLGNTNAVGAANGLTATFDLSPNLQLLKAVGQKWTCGPLVGQRLSCRFGKVLTPATASERLKLTLRTPSVEGPISASLQVSADQYDAVSANDWKAFDALSGIPDQDPTPFSFPSLVNVTPDTLVKSSTVTITGINMEVPIEISGGSYRFNNGLYTEAPGKVPPGARVTIRHRSAATPGTPTQTTLKVGSYTATFTSTTAPAAP